MAAGEVQVQKGRVTGTKTGSGLLPAPTLRHMVRGKRGTLPYSPAMVIWSMSQDPVRTLPL